jgi:hypothetical protein
MGGAALLSKDGYTLATVDLSIEDRQCLNSLGPCKTLAQYSPVLPSEPDRLFFA